MVTPPNTEIKFANHHWLEMYTFDDHYDGMIVLQWQPSVKQWCQSNNIAKEMHYIVPHNWKYNSVVFQPEKL